MTIEDLGTDSNPQTTVPAVSRGIVFVLCGQLSIS